MGSKIGVAKARKQWAQTELKRMRAMERSAKEQTARERIAHHEAGHAVVGVLLRQRFRYVTVKRQDEGLYVRLGHVQGIARGRRPDYNRGGVERTADRAVMFSMAGLEAERIYTGRQRIVVGAENDQKSAISHAEMRLMMSAFSTPDDKELGLYLGWLCYRTRAMLKTPLVWRAVESLARELLARETIKYNEARVIIQQAMSEHRESKIG